MKKQFKETKSKYFFCTFCENLTDDTIPFVSIKNQGELVRFCRICWLGFVEEIFYSKKEFNK